MQYRHIFVGVTVLTASILDLGQVVAGPTSIRDYRFSPSLSTLTVDRPWLGRADGRAARQGNVPLEFRPGSGEPWLGQTAQFDKVDAWAFNPLTAASPLNLDQALNLTGLTGIQLPVGAPFDVYEFEGKTSDGSAVNLLARLPGRFLQLSGGTEPPAGKNAPVYELAAQAWELPFADFNDDQRIDHADLLTWTGGFGAADAHGGDADGDGDADGHDFLDWQRQVGFNAAGTTSAPEPDALALGAIAAVFWTAVRRQETRNTSEPE